MTADPKAPGAAAVYLYYEDITDIGGNTHSFYERIKVLTEKGKELATVHVPYVQGADEVKDIGGRTIHSDGTVFPLTVKPDDLMDLKSKGFQENTKVFTLPNVEVGSILEYRFRYSGATFAPTWWIQQEYFVRKAHYAFRDGGGGYLTTVYSMHLGPDANVVRDKKGSPVVCNKNNVYTLDITDVPPQPDDDWMPPLNVLRWHVEFYYSSFSAVKEYWDSAGKNWAEWVRNFTNPSSLLKKAVADTVSENDSEEQKARKIYAAVQKLENTRFTRKKSEAERKKEKLKEINKAEDVWKQQSGTDDEIALLYVALARAAGLTVWPMKIVDRSRAVFDETYLSTKQLDDFIVVLELGGKEVYLDPGQKMCPFGLLHWKHSLASGLRLAKKDAVIAMTPAATYKDSRVQRVADLSIGADGNLNGSVRFVMSGQDALYWRQIALENDVEEVKKQFNESMHNRFPEGVQGDFDHFIGLEDYGSNLMGIIHVKGNLGVVTGKHLFLPELFFESRTEHPFVALDKREIPIDVHFPSFKQDEVTYHLPPGFTLENTPQPVKVAWPDYAMLKVNFIAQDGFVTVARAFAYNYTLLDPKDYANLHDFYQKVATADQQQLVLTRVSVAKGN
ncbi:MAG: DUF3857 domain-containing protein [Terracidiphilus sp.]